MHPGSWGSRSSVSARRAWPVAPPGVACTPNSVRGSQGGGGGAPTVTYNRLSHHASPQSTEGSLKTKKHRAVTHKEGTAAGGLRGGRGSPGLEEWSRLGGEGTAPAPREPTPLTRHLGMGQEAGSAREGGAGGSMGRGLRLRAPPPGPAPPREPRGAGRAPPSRRRWLPRWAGRSGDPAGVPRWRRQRRPGGRGTVQAAEAGPARLAAHGPGRGLASGRPPPLRAPRPGLSRAAAAPGDARAGPGLSLLNLGRRRARAPGSRAMALRELKVCLLGVSGGGPASGGPREAGQAGDPSVPKSSAPLPPASVQDLPRDPPSGPRAILPTLPPRPEGPPGRRGPSPRTFLEPRDSSRPQRVKSLPSLSTASRLRAVPK